MSACFAAVLWLFKIACLFLFESGDCLVELYSVLANFELASLHCVQLTLQTFFCLSELSFHSYSLSRYPEDEESF